MAHPAGWSDEQTPTGGGRGAAAGTRATKKAKYGQSTERQATLRKSIHKADRTK